MRRWATAQQLAAAVVMMALAGRPELGMGLCSVLAGALLWRTLLRLPPAAAALATLVVFLPIGAAAYHGLRNFSPLLWWASALLLAALYALAPLLLRGLGDLLAASLRRGWVHTHATRPALHLLGWYGVDLLLGDALPPAIPFPVTLGYTLVHTPWVSLAALAGPTALGLVWGLLSLALSTVMPGSATLSGASRRNLYGGVLALSASAILLHLAARLAPVGPAQWVQVTQIPEAELPEGLLGGRLAAFLSASQGANGGPNHEADTLYIWPEGALGRELAHSPAPLQTAAQQLGGSLLSGAERQVRSGAWRNSALAASFDAAHFVLDKRRLIPIYEERFEAGEGERWPLFVGAWRLATLICWESLFFEEARRRTEQGADVVVVLAHDGWARGTLTPRWHALAGRMLAWSLGRPVLVASHEGPSMLWSFDGRRLAIGVEGRDVVRALVAAPLAWDPPHLRFGGAMSIVLALLVGIGVGGRGQRVR